MNIAPDRLSSALDRGLKPIYVILAEEPLQALEAGDAVRAAARAGGFAARTVLDLAASGDWGAFEAAVRDRSLFAERGLIDLRLPSGKPGRTGAEQLARYARAPEPDLILLLQLPRPDRDMRKAAWFKVLERAAVMVHARPVPPNRLGAWIRERLVRAGIGIEPEALALLAARVEGNLLAARQEVEKLKLAGVTEIDLDTLRQGLVDVARYDLFGLPAVALSGDTARALRMLRGMLAEGQPEPLILWALARDIRALARASERRAAGEPAAQATRGFWGTDAAALRRAVDRVDPVGARRLLVQAATVDRVIKGREAGNAARQLVDLVAALSGRPLLAA
ncbi:DNA polymerase III delta subunit [Thioalkalivibrio nitratireducens DSM 14787]|uniref:DNA polymerase III subunit delta n=1 Tax=Thioalkalivibrio nitratireducens (strain DSM 14787 / UNIQEM 213 / ALEN2) TaxID=1255043 RepID=L0DYX4_THIND|nr:DNA polymerase III subunit delta [Thioalkalivibrio nitratireducens]AGA34165.1 DNA polymerase III delta subunit [Thioalkalivibrio nitratireducens DSM 14787]